MNTCIHQGIQLNRSKTINTNKDIIMFIMNPVTVSTRISISTAVFNTDNNETCFFEYNQYISMISEGSRDSGVMMRKIQLRSQE